MKTTSSIKQIGAACALALAAFTLIAATVHAAPGDLDPTFGTGGKVTTAFANWDDEAYGVAVQSDGKIVVVGVSYNYSPSDDFVLARYNADGSLDTTFGTDGKQGTDFGDSDVATSVAIQGDGRIVVAGFTGFGAGADFVLARYNTDGSLDTSFDGDGKVVTDFGSSSDEAWDVAMQGDKIVVAGSSGNDFALVRYNSDGSLDTTFDGDGKVKTSFAGAIAWASGLAVQGDTIVVAGAAEGVVSDDFAVARYNNDGSLDSGFDSDGKATTDFGGNEDSAYDVAVQPDGKIVAAGSSRGDWPNSAAALARYNTDGTLDTAFSGDGKLTAAFGGSQDAAECVAIQPDGKIVTAGNSYDGTSGKFGVARFKADGTLDPTFSGDGRVTTSFAGDDDGAEGVAIQGDGKIVVAGYAYFEDEVCDRFAVARYCGLVSADTRVGRNGAVPCGNDIYNLTGASQTQTAVIRHGGGVKNVFIGIQNDGNSADTFTVRGTRGSGLFRVKYFLGRANVTGRVQAGAFSTGVLAPGATCLLKAQITAATPLKGKARNFYINASSAADPSGNDCALIKARSN